MGLRRFVLISRIRKSRLFEDFFTPDTFFQFVRYIITGVLSFITEISLLFVLTEYAGLWYIFSNTIAYVVVFWLNFLLNKFWSFASRKDFRRQLKLYSMLFIFNLGATSALMYLLTDIAGLCYLISKVLVVGMVVTWNFFLYKKVIYK